MTTTTRINAPRPTALNALNARADQPARRVVEQRFTPNAAIPDRDEVSFTFDVADDFRIGDISLDVDIKHPHRPDLLVTVTSPSGKTAVVSDRDALNLPDLKASFDLGAAFEREPSKGQWKLTVADKAKGDVGTLKAWKLRMEEGEARPTRPVAGRADDETQFSGTVKIDTSKTADGRFQLYDKSRGQGIEIRDGMDSMTDASFKPITDEDDQWGGARNNERQKIALDAAYAAQTTYDYLRDVLGTDSIDGRGEKLLINVHLGQDDDPRTLWKGNYLEIVENGQGESWTSLDMISRQLVRGLVERKAGLKATEGEEWAVGASLRAALGGVGVEWYAAKTNSEIAAKNDVYRIGEQVKDIGQYKPTDLANPTSDGESVDHYSQFSPQDPRKYTAGLGIGGNAFYLLTHGGTNATSGIEVTDAIGMERGLKIFGGALKYLKPGATFATLRKATIDSAAELYGASSKEVRKTREAWSAVGVE